MKNRKLLTGAATVFIGYVIIILSNIAIPILYGFFMAVIQLLTPFIIGFFFSFLLHPLVDKIEEQGINRVIAVLMVFIVFILIVVYLISSIIPIIFTQINELGKQIPQMVTTVETFLDNLWAKLDFIPNKYRFHVSDIEHWSETQFLSHNVSFHMDTFLESFNIIVLSPIVTYYFLYDYNHLTEGLKKYLNRHQYRFVYKFLKESDDGVGAYFRGLILVMNLMAAASSIGFYLIGLPYPLLFGFIVGYTDAIPLIGEYIGGTPAVLYALTRNWKLAVLTLIVILIVQLIESNIVTPYVQSRSINAHPLLILFAFIIFGDYFGLLGMVFAIPLLAMLMLFMKYLKIYLRLRRIKRKMVLENK